jgi:hypothetical protein
MAETNCMGVTMFAQARSLMRVGAVLAAVAITAGCSRQQASAAAPDATTQQLHGAYAALVDAGDADSLAAAALTARTLGDAAAHPARALEMADRALASAPQRADLAFLELQLCEATASCAPQAAEARERETDPLNGISWLFALRRAGRSHDAAGVRTALAGLAGSQRVDRHWTALASRMTAAMAGKAGLDAPTALSSLIDMEAALPMPLLSVTTACSEEALQNPQVLAQCRQAAETLRHADTISVAMYGNRLAVRLWPKGSARSIEIAAAGRELAYQMDVMRRNPQRLDSPKALQILANLYPHYPTEQSVVRALYFNLGLQPDPPAQWRETVFTGKL